MRFDYSMREQRLPRIGGTRSHAGATGGGDSVRASALIVVVDGCFGVGRRHGSVTPSMRGSRRRRGRSAWLNCCTTAAATSQTRPGGGKSGCDSTGRTASGAASRRLCGHLLQWPRTRAGTTAQVFIEHASLNNAKNTAPHHASCSGWLRKRGLRGSEGIGRAADARLSEKCRREAHGSEKRPSSGGCNWVGFDTENGCCETQQCARCQPVPRDPVQCTPGHCVASKNA